MVRLFEEHSVRKTHELSSSMWDFSIIKDGKSIAINKVAVPSCWETYPGFETYRGKCLYERDFISNGDVRLVFKGVSHTATVYVDGKEIAHHYNAFTPFDALVRRLKEGKHRLSVMVDNTFSEESALHVENDYQSYGGISRGVVLEEICQQYIKKLHVTPFCKDGKWYASLEISIENISEEAQSNELEVILTKEPPVISKDKTICGYSEYEVLFRKEYTAADGLITIKGDMCECTDVKSWSVESPQLYYVTALLKDKNGNILDDLTDRIGFRQIRIDKKDVWLNDKKMKIKGFCRHEDHPQYGCALPLSAISHDLMLMKDMGANSVRTSHYPNDELFLDMCDELGILVWEENHARGLSESQMRNPNFERQCEDCIKEMIDAHYNHPSIYIWGILNECASDTEYGRLCYEKQLSLIKSLDETRPRSFASCRFKTDICLDLVDIVSYNIYPKWYHNTPVSEYLDDLYKWIQTTDGKGKPFMVTEIGAGAIYGYRTPSRVKWSEEYQCQTLREQLSSVCSYKDCMGVYIWQFCDVRVTDDWWSTRPRTMNNKGVVDEYRRPKLSYEVVKEIFSNTDK